ncbi:MAG TPA: flavin reductase family protein [Anaerolineaceae bacterium]|nr:flavin reductase family protein [Anaerolineaceae bacterium]
MKIKLGKIPYVYPIPIALAGALVNGKANFELVGDVGLMGINPPLVYVSSSRAHYTNQGIVEHAAFSLNFPNTAMMALADYCGIVSGREVDKGILFDIFYGELLGAPMIAACPLNLECKVVHEFSIQHRQVFVGEVVQAHASEEYTEVRDGNRALLDLTRLDPILYALDNRYYSIGKAIGFGYQEGKPVSHGGEV